MSMALVFPGQGSQAVGMGKALAADFAAARAVFDEVDAALGQKLSALMFEGPESELTLTANAQPALMAVSLAALRVLESEAGLDVARDAAFAAGHSLGEYSALAATGALTVADTARLLRLRGEAMQKAVPVGRGAMAALLGLDYETGVSVAREASAASGDNEICEIANDNGGGQVVASGTKKAVDQAIEIAKGKGARRAMLLTVSAPFHCALMQPAAEAMEAALARANIAAPKIPVVANITARPVTDAEGIRRGLVAQVTGTVRWRESVAFMASAGVNRFLRAWHRQGADGPRQTHRGGRDGDRHRHAGRHCRLHRTRRLSTGNFRCSTLTGKTALVTGASGGIGGAIAMALHRAGRDGRHSRERVARRSTQLRERTRRARPCPALQPRRQGCGRSPRPRSGGGARSASTFSSITPASPATACSCA